MTTSFANGMAALVQQIDAPIAAYLQSCVHCGLCAEACLFYTETGEAKYTPIHKVEPLKKLWKQEFTLFGRLLKAIGVVKPFSDEDLAEWEELVYDSCTLCGRCTMVCPVGNDITYMIRKLREGMVASGHAPDSLKTASRSALAGISPIGVGLVALKKQIEKQSKETGIPVEMDKEGAEFLVVLSSMEIIGFPEIIGALSKLFQRAGATWTIASDAYEATNIGIQIGSRDVARALVQRIVTAAERLKVKTVISPECGHAYQALRWDGPNLIGRPYGFKVVHIVDLLDQWVREGRIRTKGKHPDRVSYHDPCQISRRGGLDAPARRLLAGVAADIVEAPETGAMGWCCGGGGGVSANARAEDLRLKVFTAKKRQIEAVQPKQLVTACANCRNVMEEAIDHYEMTLPVLGLTEMIAEYLEDDAP